MKGKGNARRPGEADLSVVARLRRAWTQEEEGERGDPGVEQRFAAWFQREPARRRVTWLAEVDGQLVGMMNPAISERMPRPGHMPGRWGYLVTHSCWRPTRARGSAGCGAQPYSGRHHRRHPDRGEAMQLARVLLLFLPFFGDPQPSFLRTQDGVSPLTSCGSSPVAKLPDIGGSVPGLRRYQARGQAAKRSRSRAISSWLSPNGAKIPSPHLSRRRPASAKSRRVSPGSSRRAKLITWSML